MSNNKGQSTFEFLFVFAFAAGLLTLFVQTARIFTAGYITHYATYMASRTYLVWDTANANPDADYANTASTRAFGMAQSMFERYQVEVFGVIDPNGEFDVVQRDLSGGNIAYELTGAKFKYNQPLSLMNFIGGNANGVMISESFLGKEPTRGECYNRTLDALETLDIPSGLGDYVTIFDNGC